MIQIPADDKIRTVIDVPKLDDENYVNNHYVVLCTKKGIIKKTKLADFSRPRANGIIAITIEDGDQLIVGSGLSTDEIMTTLQTNNKSLVEITDNLKVITKRMVDGEGSMGKILKDDAIYNDLSNAVAGLKVTVTNTQRLTDALALYANRLHTKGALANDLVTDTLIFHNLRRASDGMNTVVEQANYAVAELQEASEGVKTGLADQQAAAGMILHDTLFADALKATILNLQASTEKLDTNMLALRNNFFFRGFFRKQAKQERKEQKAREKAERKAARQAGK